MPDPDRPSAAPLSETEADRLSERFTASWDEAEPPTLEPKTEPLARPAPTAHNPKATLLGIAPIVVGAPSRPPAAQSPAPATAKPAVAPAPAVPTVAKPILSEVPTAPAPPVAVAVAVAGAPATTIPLAAAPVATVATPTGVAPPPPPPPLAPPAQSQPELAPAPQAASTPPPSSPDASSIATGLTTPAKPYIPKDDPSTPAVVISDAVPTEAPKPDRARIAQTLPAQTRSAPFAAPAPLAAAPATPSAPASAILDDTYPPARKRGSKLPLILGGAALLGAAALAAVKLGGHSEPRASTQPTSVAAPIAIPASEPAAAPTPTPTTTDNSVAPSAPQRAADAAPVPNEAGPSAAEPEEVAVKKSRAPIRKAPLAAAPKKSSARAEPKSEGKTSAPAEGPATSKPNKGVIVRETPF